MSGCTWPGTDPLYLKYHDEEWGVPVHDDRKLFEFLILEGAQAGLSWITILRRREGYRRAFDNFDPRKIANYSQKDIDRLLADEGIIRNRAKIRSAISNAQAFLKVQEKYGTFDAYMWGFVNGKALNERREGMGDIPARTELSDLISKDMKKKGFSFVGSTIIYAHMQATGMVNDHVIGCFRHAELS